LKLTLFSAFINSSVRLTRPILPSCHRLVLELSRAYKEGKQPLSVTHPELAKEADGWDVFFDLNFDLLRL